MHIPATPTWTCRLDGLTWPCREARRALVAEYAGNPSALSIYLTCCLHEATRDLVNADPAALYERFLSWVPHPLNARCSAPRPWRPRR